MKVNAMSLGILMRMLCLPEPHTVAELVEATGLFKQTIRNWLRELHRQHVVFIAGYDVDVRGRRNTPLWKFGIDRADAKRSPQTRAQRAKKVYHRNRSATLLGLRT